LSREKRLAGGVTRVRRSPHLVFYWRRGRLIGRNYATGAVAVVSPWVCHLLDYCGEWRTTDEIRTSLPATKSARPLALIRQLVARSFLQQSDNPEDPRERAMGTLEPWNPEAGFFHTATKNVRFWSQQEAQRKAREQALEAPMPAAVKRYPGIRAIALPPPSGIDDFARVACERRTWRRFSAAAVTIEELATLLGLSVGVQKWVRLGGRDVALKTSPSGGARHPVEAYVVARRVRGLPSGTYHYTAGRHALTRLRKAPSAARLKVYMPNSGHFADAAALVLFTVAFERQLWRYPYSRAYRAALIETGHVCQTFCLAATALRLAPFSLMGLADAAIERDLGIDGITETVLYAAGVGRPPTRATWAPLNRGTLSVRPNPRMQ
jgi:SagB-type dehydrogenase family enzyme